MKVTEERRGYITEVALEFLAYNIGIDISIPRTPLRYDQVWDIGNRLLRVQIKSCQEIIKDNILYGIEFPNNKYNANEIDGMATMYKGKIYYIPIEKCARENKLYFLINKGHDSNEFKWAQDYEINSLNKLKSIVKNCTA